MEEFWIDKYTKLKALIDPDGKLYPFEWSPVGCVIHYARIWFNGNPWVTSHPPYGCDDCWITTQKPLLLIQFQLNYARTGQT